MTLDVQIFETQVASHWTIVNRVLSLLRLVYMMLILRVGVEGLVCASLEKLELSVNHWSELTRVAAVIQHLHLESDLDHVAWVEWKLGRAAAATWCWTMKATLDLETRWTNFLASRITEQRHKAPLRSPKHTRSVAENIARPTRSRGAGDSRSPR